MGLDAAAGLMARVRVSWSGVLDDGSSLDRHPSIQPFAGRLTSGVVLELDPPAATGSGFSTR